MQDFETTKAIPLLERYRYKYRVFNDDIQGTGSVTLAGVMSAAKMAGIPLTQMRFMCVGAGSAGKNMIWYFIFIWYLLVFIGHFLVFGIFFCVSFYEFIIYISSNYVLTLYVCMIFI